ncbi:hypothetical protein AB0I16_15635 [Streptomyces sp. NPDC050703]|uniref:hypothetical protein n=1 Tax=Streptomyces sp. NPDC050703 TaxID=3157218 RepID=UPI003449E783
MSTEARRTPIPPVPATPPLPTLPPDPPPPPSARFPDVRPPVDDDWLLNAPHPTAHPEPPPPSPPTCFPDAGPAVAEAVAQAVGGADAAAGQATDGEVSSATEAPPASSARFPDARPAAADAPPAILDRADDVAERIEDLLAPFERARAPREAVPPPPPASARLPDAPPGATAEPSAPPAETEVPEAAPDDAPPRGDRSRATAARRAVGAVDPAPGPGAGRPFIVFAPPALYDDTTTRLRRVGAWARPRVAAAAACAVVGLGLIGGAVTGSWLTGESAASGSDRGAYEVTGALWHSVPVDRLFPPTLKGGGAGPGGADRSWTRIAVAPDSDCRAAFDPLLAKALAPAGCLRLLRATYADATRSHVTTVGLMFAKADADAMRALRTRVTEEGLDRRTDLMPRAYAADGTLAEHFGDAQRAAWTLSVLPDAPVIAYAVSGFADGRAVTDPEPAAEAMEGNDSAPAQSGLGHEAKGIADRVERGLRKTIADAEKDA